jgi:hypothetical protein
MRPLLPVSWLVVLLCSFAWCAAHAADWSLVPQVDLGAKYDSNINFNYIAKESDYIFNVSPALDVNYESEVTKITGRLALEGLAYIRNPNLDTINQYYSFSGKRQVAPRLALAFTGGYILDTTLNEELIASGFIMNRTRRQALQAAPGLTFNLTERALLQLGYGYFQAIYQDPDYINYYSQSVSLGLKYLLKNAKTTVTGTVLGRYTDYPAIANTYRNIGAYLGVEHKFSEDWTLALLGGANFNWFTSQTAVLDFGNNVAFIRLRQFTDKSFTVSPYFNISALRRWTKTNLTCGYSVDQSPSASGTINQFHSGYAGISRNFTERLTGGVQGGLYYSLSTSPGSDYNNLILYVSPNLSYKLTEKISMNSSYTYGWRDDLVGERTTSRNQVWLYLRYANPLHYQR